MGWVMATYLIIIGFMVMAAITGRKQQGGYIHFKQALQGSFLVAVVSLFMWGLFTWAMASFVDTNINKYSKAKAMEFNQKVMEWSGATEEQMEEQMDRIDKQDFSQNFWQFMLGVASQYIVGFVYALIISGIFHLAFSKKRTEAFPQ